MNRWIAILFSLCLCLNLLADQVVAQTSNPRWESNAAQDGYQTDEEDDQDEDELNDENDEYDSAEGEEDDEEEPEDDEDD